LTNIFYNNYNNYWSIYF